MLAPMVTSQPSLGGSDPAATTSSTSPSTHSMDESQALMLMKAHAFSPKLFAHHISHNNSKASTTSSSGGSGSSSAGGGAAGGGGAAVTAPVKMQPSVKIDFRREVYSCAFSKDVKWIAAGAYDGLTVISGNTGEKVFEKTEGGDSISAVCFTHDSLRVISAGADKVVRIYKVDSGELLTEMRGHTGQVYSLAVSPDNKMIASGSGDKSLRLWSTESGEEIGKMDHRGQVYGVSFSNDTPTSRIATVTFANGYVSVFDAQTRRLIKADDIHSYGYCCSFSPDNTKIASGGKGGEIIISNSDTLVEIKKIQVDRSPVIHSVAFSGNGSLLAAAAGRPTNEVFIYNTSTYAEVRCLKEHTGDVSCVFFFEGSSLLSSSEDKTVRCWELPASDSAVGE